jgi:hypothetical protein
VLYVADGADAAGHRGLVIAVDRSRFAPSYLLLRNHANPGLCGPDWFARRYAQELRGLWRADAGLFLDLVARARTGHLTLVDSWGDAAHAPRRALARVLAGVARWQRRRQDHPAA